MLIFIKIATSKMNAYDIETGLYTLFTKADYQLQETCDDNECYAWVDTQLQQRENLHIFDMELDNHLTADTLLLSKTNHHFYYLSNDDFEFYFMYDHTSPITWDILSINSHSFHHSFHHEHHDQDNDHDDEPFPHLVIDQFTLDALAYRQLRIRGDCISHYF